MLLLIDNYDSFTFNLARYFQRLTVDVVVLRNDHEDLCSTAEKASAIVISPGPCGPEQAGKSIEIVERFSGSIPILGICLGHQVICHAFGANIVRACRPIHGQAFAMDLAANSDLFQKIPSGTRFARYHSLIVDPASLPACFHITASCETSITIDSPDRVREVMAVEHVSHKTYGVQFHPESILSDAGYQLLANFLEQCGWSPTGELPPRDLTDTQFASRLREPVADASLNHTAVLPQY